VLACMNGSQEFNAHTRGWQKSLQLFEEAGDIKIDLKKENAENIINKLMPLKKLDEDHKISLIQNFIKQGISDSEK